MAARRALLPRDPVQAVADEGSAKSGRAETRPTRLAQAELADLKGERRAGSFPRSTPPGAPVAPPIRRLALGRRSR